MTNIPIKRLIAFAIIAVSALAGFTYLGTTRQPRGTFVLLLDHSASAQTPAVRDCARIVINRAVEDGATLYIAPVGRLATANWKAIDTGLAGAGKSNKKTAREQQDRSRAAAETRVQQVLAGPTPPGASDYIAATTAAARLLANEPGPRRLLAACGDMHQVGSGLNVYREPLDGDHPRAVIARLRLLLPDFGKKVEVVIGAGGLDHAPLSTAREEAIQRFWTDDWAPAVHVRSMTYDSTPHLSGAGS
jgi:hypothetical protein